MMTLERFKIMNFRSIMDSGWIDCDKITSLVGINEAGKSNLILALWKLKPARSEAGNAIKPRDDMPRHKYTEWKSCLKDICFVSTIFLLDEALAERIASFCGCESESVKNVQISRYYDGEYEMEFPDYVTTTKIDAQIVLDIITSTQGKIDELNEIESQGESDEEDTPSEKGIKETILNSLSSILESLDKKDCLTEDDYKNILAQLPKKLVRIENSEIYPEFLTVEKKISNAFLPVRIKDPAEIEEIFELVKSEMPSFVYYSDYGNLDAEIYLPQAVKLLESKDIVGFDNAAKVRTLRMLFEFVNLDPSEVLQLGKDPFSQERVVTITKTVDSRQPNVQPKVASETSIVDVDPSEDEIKEAEDNKSERKIQLNSASASFTSQFKNWWKQGDYIFEFDADGDYPKIWVADNIRPSKIELRERSTGLQWFFSFFLVFLVESREAHKGTILLLDEAGLTLHPLAQKDLICFFENLSEENQIIHTTHSPFLIDTNNIDRVKVVYMNNEGYTVSSNNLRDGISSENKNSIYAAHAALGLSVSDVLLQGCLPVIVEGTSDQYLLNAIKLHLIQNKKIAPDKEIVFLPGGGTSTKGIQGIIGILGGKSEELPPVLLDSDCNGNAMKTNLSSGLYKGNFKDKLVSVEDITKMKNAEVEDIIPYSLMSKEIDRILRNENDLEFEDVYSDAEPILPQIEKFAEDNSIVLMSGWKVELARKVKIQLLRSKVPVEEKYMKMWIKIFKYFIKVDAGDNQS